MYIIPFFQALSDWCMDPNPFLEEQLGKLVSEKVPAYYLRCDAAQVSPFARYLTHAQQAANVVLTSLNRVTRIAEAHYEPKLVSVWLEGLQTLVGWLFWAASQTDTSHNS